MGGPTGHSAGLPEGKPVNVCAPDPSSGGPLWWPWRAGRRGLRCCCGPLAERSHFRSTWMVRTCATFIRMSLSSLPGEFDPLRTAAVDAIRRAYEINSQRYEPDVGDDAVVFGIAIYRNSWYLIEQEVLALDHWRSARPAGSLLVVGAGLRIHVYRHGQDGSVDLDGFRLDDAASATKRDIAESNADQLVLDLYATGGEDSEEGVQWTLVDPVTIEGLRDLVIVHAGNPDEGCCGIWIGAPVATEDPTASPWAWIEPLWLPDAGAEAGSTGTSTSTSPVPHYELPEPVITLRPIREDEAGQEES